ncbi:uncharacterized protein BN452_00067 [Clostridium sp. CAG:1013]|nr:uncharacterized protein BN452_00067 [Clostridium sp. CAG:1013]
MAFDYKKEYKEFYLPPKKPGIVTVPAMEEYVKAQGIELDFGENRFHHEIYLSDVRRCKPERLKTVIRHPVRRPL